MANRKWQQDDIVATIRNRWTLTRAEAQEWTSWEIDNRINYVNDLKVKQPFKSAEGKLLKPKQSDAR